MTIKKRPTGKDWDWFIDAWYEVDHNGKIKLATQFGVTYETMKHWVSDSGATRKQVKPEQRMTVTIPELLAMWPSVKLDFACFDLETSNLNADFSILLTAAIKPYGQEPIVFRADDYPEWKTDRANDYKITKAIAEELRTHAVVVTHYGLYFDIPYLRAKMGKHGIEPLPLMYLVDTWSIAKKNFKVSSRRLANLANYFDVGNKSGVEGGLWMEAAYNGDKEAMDKIVEHNIVDVEVLEKLACLSFPYLKSIPKL